MAKLAIGTSFLLEREDDVCTAGWYALFRGGERDLPDEPYFGLIGPDIDGDEYRSEHIWRPCEDCETLMFEIEWENEDELDRRPGYSFMIEQLMAEGLWPN